jgi:hypothetical protein
VTIIKRKPGFSRKRFWTLEISFKTGFTVIPFGGVFYDDFSFVEYVMLNGMMTE